MVKEIGFAKVAKEKYGDILGNARLIEVIKEARINLSVSDDFSEDAIRSRILGRVPKGGADFYTASEVKETDAGTEFSTPTYSTTVTFYKDITPKHPRNVVGYTGSLNDLSREMGDMQYDCIASVLDGLSDYLAHQAKQDEGRNRPKLAGEVMEASAKLKTVSSHLLRAHEICAPYMEEENAIH